MGRLANALLLFSSLLAGLVLCEVFLRTFYPKYQYAAESQYSSEALRIWTREAGAKYERTHPDDGFVFDVIHNNLSFRQHRDFTEEDITSSTNVAFFGDSYVENLRIQAQYSFTEPLDYLLNRSGESFNVFNIGVDGYGTDQSFLYYKDFKYKSELDYVFYVFCHNDLRDIYVNELFEIDGDSGELKTAVHRSRPWPKFISRLHTTYLFLDTYFRIFGDNIDLEEVEEIEIRRQAASGRNQNIDSPLADSVQLSFVRGNGNAAAYESITLFNKILREWKNMAEDNGSRFFVVMLPMEESKRLKDIVDGDIKVIDMYEMCRSLIPNYDFSDSRFTSDSHWNEFGNMLAALNLFRAFEQEAALRPLGDREALDALNEYYSAFDGWKPQSPWASDTRATPAQLMRIVEKYLQLELESL